MNKKTNFTKMIIMVFVIFPIIFGSKQAISLDKDEFAYLVTVHCNISIWIEQKKFCDAEQKYRKQGRWYYKTIKKPCPEMVKVPRLVILTDVFEAKNRQEAIKKAKEKMESRGFTKVIVKSAKWIN